MKKTVITLLALIVALTSMGQNKNDRENDQDTKDPNHIKVVGYADTLLTPTFADFLISKQYKAKYTDENTLGKLEQELKDNINRAGGDASKVTFSSNFNNNGGNANGSDMVRVVLTVHVADLNKIDLITKVLTDLEYSTLTKVYGIDENQLNTEAIDKILLSRALENGREKGKEVADLMGVKKYRMISFNEATKSNQRANNYTKRDRGAGVEKIKIEKHVNMIYKMEE